MELLNRPVNKFKVKLLNQLLDIFESKIEAKIYKIPYRLDEDSICARVVCERVGTLWVSLNLVEDENFIVDIRHEPIALNHHKLRIEKYLGLEGKDLSKFSYLVKPTYSIRFYNEVSHLDIKLFINFLNEFKPKEKVATIQSW